jgi:PPOX class probable F420-dependent enzyme
VPRRKGKGHSPSVGAVELSTAVEFVRAHRQGVLVTLQRSGRPQISNIVYAIDDGGTIRISVTASRAKTKNLQRDPRVSLYVCGENFWAYAVVEGEAELSPVASDPDDATVEELITVYRALSGEHPDWDEYRRAMVDQERLVVRLVPTRAYGMLPG